ncbi:DNA topoisomerase IV subunit A [Propionicimonas sp.]|uniref:DNA gyrase/topoisomerase IV subunit A n=1 Tax=Propionicimonas sp. TaxID=1955623 RepID=UPI001856F288|nr:DNA topoisomerase IV subunit A [Propionicimonas sp.]MBU3977264.1 DNA topoisomerase IV subunit A [Actinomycetota bacterium]MBA3021189.1 DNA topoisomerase IV subunit A [Propionicimonas sp.]MBU3985774.1 DNA topoisomerase IV subunit A [Actinomycetota bacterium]MBU4008559.1 DNA topoisomerase IV subunit A [Actinomycetota bacterium]MBU4066291.1 DNA topoisomerase IV subunit A [Actinomycetota bacterium]
MVAKPPPVEDDFAERIVDVDVSSEMETSFLEYAYSVIYSRALPDARDGLKPVQRRILYGMDQMRIRPDASHVKCSRVVGQVMGLYHPHGDSAIYEALVRLGQTWSMRLPTVDGHGNFGSLDSGPAAMRYTECRMAPAAVAMTADIESDTVDFRPNYDGKESEPIVLPAAFPNLLVNGSTGIAVGMATNIPPHNLVEVVHALKHLLKHPDADSEELMRFVPGPDFPTGGKIIGLDGVRDAYLTGRGQFKVRSSARIEQVSPRRKGIVVTELPYQIGPERIIEQVKTLVTNKKLTGIADIKDLTDLANGTRLVIEVKNGINPEALLEELFRLTKLEDSFSSNNVALVDGQPSTLGLRAMLTVYLDHRLQVIRRRSAYLLGRAKDRLHLVEGLLLAIVDIDDVIAIIRSSDDAAQARVRLMEAFELSETQTNYILDMQLRRLTKFSRIDLEAERDKLWQTISDLQAILDSDERLREVTATELDEVARTHGTPRRTVLLASAGNQVTAAKTAAALEIADDPCWLMLSSAGLLARTDNDDPLPSSGPRAVHDVIVSAVRTTARGDFCAFTNTGRLLRGHAIEVPSVPVTASAPNLQGGSPASELLPLEPGERILGLGTLSGSTFGWALGTKRGVVKRVNPEVLAKDAWEIIRLEDGDEVVGAVELTHDLVSLVFITSDAQLLHFPAAGVRPQGRSGGGMAGVKLAGQAQVLFFGATPTADSSVVTVAGSSAALPGTDAGSIKLTPLAEYPTKGRATGGVRCQRLLKGEDVLLLAWAGPDPAIAAAASGSPIELPPLDPRRDGSGISIGQPVAAVGSRYHA